MQPSCDVFRAIASHFDGFELGEFVPTVFVDGRVDVPAWKADFDLVASQTWFRAFADGWIAAVASPLFEELGMDVRSQAGASR